jgi:hypothetical protein
MRTAGLLRKHKTAFDTDTNGPNGLNGPIEPEASKARVVGVLLSYEQLPNSQLSVQSVHSVCFGFQQQVPTH